MTTQSNSSTRPRAKVIGQDGNVFNILAICSKALKRAGLHTEAGDMQKRVFESSSYDAALAIMMKYVDFI